MFDTIRQFSELRESFQSLDAYDDLMYACVCVCVLTMYKCTFLCVYKYTRLGLISCPNYEEYTF
jgi:hypothetical protein